MKPYTDRLTLSDGATVRVRIERGPTNDAVLHELNSNNWERGGRIYWNGSGLFLIWGEHEELHRLEDSRYESAGTVTEAASKALAFFAQCAESTITHARTWGIPVQSCYGA